MDQRDCRRLEMAGSSFLLRSVLALAIGLLAAGGVAVAQDSAPAPGAARLAGTAPSAGLTAGAVPAGPADAFAQDEDAQRVDSKICDRIFEGLRHSLEKLTARVNTSKDIQLTLLGCEKDARHRVYIDMDGELDFTFPVMPEKLRTWIEDLRGQTLQSNGPVAVDFTVNVVESTGEKSYHIEFTSRTIVVLGSLLSHMVHAGATIAGSITLFTIGRDLAALLEQANMDLLADGLTGSLRGLTHVFLGLAGVEAFDAYRATARDRSDLVAGQNTAGVILSHLGRTIVQGFIRTDAKLIGLSMGAAIGAAIFPVAGATVGAVLGVVGLTVVGHVVFHKVAVDLPMRYRLARIRRLSAKRDAATDPDRRDSLAAKAENEEIKVVKRVSVELLTDNFSFLDKLIDLVKAMPPEERVAYAGLHEKLADKLRFEVVHHQDQLFARELGRLQAAFAR